MNTASGQWRRVASSTLSVPVALMPKSVIGSRAAQSCDGCAAVWITSATAALVLHEAASAPLRTAELPQRGDVVLIVGPEGGLTEEELTVFRAAGAVPVRLGPQVLRTSTAGAVALGALGVLTGRWS